jgi:hypothetical protein
MLNLSPLPHLLHQHHETSLVFDQTSRIRFSPCADEFDGTMLFDDDETYRNFFLHLDNFFIQLNLPLFNPKSSLPDNILLV